ncbi:MAG: hypothetical protein ACJA13_001344, partial [Paraglaciecola sp.]
PAMNRFFILFVIINKISSACHLAIITQLKLCVIR